MGTVTKPIMLNETGQTMKFAISQVAGALSEEKSSAALQNLEIASLGAGKSLTLTNGTSTLLAEGSAVSEARTKLIISNESDIRILLQPETTTTPKVGLPVEAHQTIVLSFPSGNTTAVCGRSTGYSADITVWEV